MTTTGTILFKDLEYTREIPDNIQKLTDKYVTEAIDETIRYDGTDSPRYRNWMFCKDETIRSVNYIASKVANDMCYDDAHDPIQSEKSIFNTITHAISLNPDVVIVLSRVLKDIYKIDEFDEIVRINLFTDNLTDAEKDSIHVNSDGELTDSDARFMVGIIARDVERITNNPRTLAEEVSVKMFKQLSNQSRWGTIWKQLLSVLLYRDTTVTSEVMKYIQWYMNDKIRYHVDLKSVRCIIAILANFKTIPFYPVIKNMVIRKQGNMNWKLTVVPLLYSLMELSYQEMGCNILGNMVDYAIELRCNAARFSFETSMLNNKSSFNSVINEIEGCLGNHMKLSYDGGLRYIISEKMSSKSKETMDSRLMTLLNDLSTDDPIVNSNRARWMLSVLQILSNPGIYYRSSLTIEKLKSIGAQIASFVELPPVKSYVIEDGTHYPYEYDWDKSETWKEIKAEYFKILESATANWSDMDFTSYFVNLLTNRSQGVESAVDYDPITRAMMSDERLQNLKAISKTRLFGFLNNPSEYTDPRLIDLANQMEQLCTLRYQNNRRPRIVEIVKTASQLGPAILLEVFNWMKNAGFWPEVAVGKQESGIVDMEFQLRATGSDNAHILFSDIVAMDASTQRFVSVLFAQLAAEYIDSRQIGPDNYFAFGTHDVMLLDGKGNKDIATVKALSSCLRNMIRSREYAKYMLKDNIFKNLKQAPGLGTIEVTNAIFESGRFDTSAQHTVLLSVLARLVSRYIRNKHGTKVSFSARKFGDDSIEVINFNTGDEKVRSEILQDITSYEIDMLSKVGFAVEVDSSSIMGDFLQQLAFLGVNVPKSARSSVFTNEDTDTLNRDQQESISIMTSVIHSSSQRHYSPYNSAKMVRSIWICNRSSYIPEFYREFGKKWDKYIIKLPRGSLFIQPYTCIFMPPHNCKMPIVATQWGLIPSTSILRPLGYGRLTWIFNFMGFDKLEGTTYINREGGKYMQDIGNDFIKRLESIGFIDALEINAYSRGESKKRQRIKDSEEDIKRLSTQLSYMYPPEKLFASMQGEMNLTENYGINPPKHLAYYKDPENRVISMFTSKDETSSEVAKINDSWIRYLRNTDRAVSRKVAEMVCNSTFFFEMMKGKNECYFDTSTFPLMPGYHIRDFKYGQLIFGSPFEGNTGTRVVRGLTSNGYGKIYDIDTAIKIGQQAKFRGVDALTSYYDFLGLNFKERNDMSKVLESGSYAGLNDFYKSGYQPENHFALRMDATRILPRLIIPSNLSRRLKLIMQHVGRDLLMTAPEMLFDCKISLMPSTQLTAAIMRTVPSVAT